MITPALDERRACGELPPRPALCNRELQHDPGRQRPHEREAVFGAGDRGRHHVSHADARCGEKEAGPEVGEFASRQLDRQLVDALAGGGEARR